MRFFLLTDVSGGETWRHFPVQSGDIMLGDRGYANPKGVYHVTQAHADVVVRLNRQALPLFDERGERLDVVYLARRLKARECGEWAAWVTNNSKDIPGRLLAVRRSRQATEDARRRLKRLASKQQARVSEKSLEAAQYFFLWTTLRSSLWDRHEILELYRCRWQIELAFKRMKSIMGLGHLPKKDPESCRAWLHGKLLTSLLVEALMSAARTFSPWGYELAPAQEQMA